MAGLTGLRFGDGPARVPAGVVVALFTHCGGDRLQKAGQLGRIVDRLVTGDEAGDDSGNECHDRSAYAVVADGPLAVWGWAPVTGDVPTSLAKMATELPSGYRNVHIAAGSPHPGAAGFRISHLEAIRTRRIIDLSGRVAPSITAFTDIALVDAISRDLDTARAFVAAQLGDLAHDDAKARDERAALLAVLDAQGSLITAARTLGIPRNTILQRMRRAE